MPTTASAIGMPFQEAVDYFRQKTNMPTKHWTEVMDEAHARSFMVAGAAKDALVQDFRDAVDKAISKGTGLNECRKDFDEIVKRHGWSHTGTADWRARIIYQTNISTAYAAGRYAQMTDPDVLAAFPYWEYLHVNCPNPRPQHVAWSGMVLRADDPFWATCYPPNGWGCHCIVGTVNARGLARMGKSGPDASPNLEWREYVNQTTGVVTKYPAGVDPGFAYNPGKAWKDGAKQPGARTPVKAPDVKPVAPAIPLPKVPRLGTTEDADKKLTEAMRPWADRLTEDENAALDDYKGVFGRAMNAAVRGAPGADPSLPRRARILEAALDRARMPETVRTWRAIGPEEARIYLDASVGKSVEAPAFVSTTIDQATAKKMATLNKGAVIQVIVPKGTRGAAYVHPFPKYRFRQYEVLLNVGTKLRIIRNDGAQLVLVAGDEDP